jgi:hypothetical protein
MDAVKGKKPVSRDNIGMTRLDTRRVGGVVADEMQEKIEHNYHVWLFSL